MARCERCNKDTGWGGDTICNDCEPKYGDKVMITGGFFKGQQGTVIGKEGFGNYVNSGCVSNEGYKVRLNDGKEVCIVWSQVKKI